MIIQNKDKTLAYIHRLQRAAEDEAMTISERLRHLCVLRKVAECARVQTVIWPMVVKAMSGQSVQVDAKIRVGIDDGQWTSKLQSKNIDQISDRTVTFAVHFLGKVLDHLRMLRAMDAFFTGLNLHLHDPQACAAFNVWKLHNSYMQLSAEAATSKDEKRTQVLMSMAEATANAFEILFGPRE